MLTERRARKIARSILSSDLLCDMKTYFIYSYPLSSVRKFSCMSLLLKYYTALMASSLTLGRRCALALFTVDLWIMYGSGIAPTLVAQPFIIGIFGIGKMHILHHWVIHPSGY